MSELRIDLRGRAIETLDDFWDAIAEPCGLPEWFGRNLDAWSDTINGGAISEVIDSHDLLVIDVDRKGLFAGDHSEALILEETFDGQTSQLRIHPVA